MTEKSTILQDIRQAVFSIDPDAEAFLFGSRTHGDFNEESDWDLLVVAENDERDGIFKRKISNVLYHLEVKENLVITPVVFEKSFWKNLCGTPFYQEVVKDRFLLK